jgi:nucleoside-diphosphate-sugar epimerase
MQTKPTIAITGANGFIGSYLVELFLSQGYNVVALSRQPGEKVWEGATSRRFDLEALADSTDLSGCDILIHCAYKKQKPNEAAGTVNVEGTKALYEAAKKAGVKKFIFLSSLSAHEKAISQYGRTKLEIEHMLNPKKDLILKPGLVLGHGGLFGNILQTVQHSWFVPLVDNGRQKLQAIDIDDLGKCIITALDKDILGNFTLIADKDFTLRDMAAAIRAKSGRKVPFISVPYWVVNFGLTLIELLHIPFPVSRENLLGLRQNVTWKSGDCQRVFGIKPKPYIESINRLVEEAK